LQLRKDPNNDEANRNYFTIESLKKDYTNSRMAYADKDYHNAVHLLSKVIENCPWDIGLREMRSECYLALGDAPKAISDLKAATKLMSDNTAAFMKLARLYYGLGEAEESLK
jgi:DnaJ homolog subfamily C member 3